MKLIYGFFFLFLISFSCLGAAATNHYVVHHLAFDHFRVNGQDFPYDKDFPLSLGSLIEINRQNKEKLTNESYRWIFDLQNPITGKWQTFYSRPVSQNMSGVIKKLTETRRAPDQPGVYINGFHPIVEYDVELEDGAVYHVAYTHGWHQFYESEEEAKAALDTIFLEEGDKFVFKDDCYMGNIFRYNIEANHGEEKKNGHLLAYGPLRGENLIPLPDNQFRIKYIQNKQIRGICPRSYVAIEFEDFSPGKEFVQSNKSELSLSDVSNCKTLQFVSQSGNGFIFRDLSRKKGPNTVCITPRVHYGF